MGSHLGLLGVRCLERTNRGGGGEEDRFDTLPKVTLGIFETKKPKISDGKLSKT